jgi:hypothetical protein
MTLPAEPSGAMSEPGEGASEGQARAGATIDVAAAAGLRVPDFFILGHQKCGTTALHVMLDRHPGIFMPGVKEPRFLATDLRSPLPARSEQAKQLRTVEGYLALFAEAGPQQRVGEASPQYLRSRDAPANIRALQPDARMIAIVREPASFLRSFHMQMVSSHVEDEGDLRRALELEPERREGRRIPRDSQAPKSLLYSEHVRYAEQLARFEAELPRENLMVIVYDDFRDDNAGTLLSILRFLGVDESVPLQTQQTRPLPAARSLRVHRLVNNARIARRNPEAAGRVGRTLDAISRDALRSDRVRGLWRRLAYSEPPPPDAELMLELRRRFKPEVEQISERLARDLVALWGYDALD